jgi:hypothetical protein
VERGDRRVEGVLVPRHLAGVVLTAVDGQAAEPLQERPDQGVAEERRLGQRSGGPPRGVEQHERVEERVDVVGRDQDRTVRDGRPGALDLLEERGGMRPPPG